MSTHNIHGVSCVKLQKLWHGKECDNNDCDKYKFDDIEEEDNVFDDDGMR